MPIDPASRVRWLIQRLQPRFRRRFLEVVESIRDQHTMKALAELLTAGRADLAMAHIEAATVALGNLWGETFMVSGQETAGQIGAKIPIILNLNTAAGRAASIMQQNQLRLVREFSQEQRRATEQALIDGIGRGITSAKNMAREFRMSIGLTQKQVIAVNNYRRLLESGSRQALDRGLRDRRFDSTVLAAADFQRFLTPAQIDRMVERYAEKSLRYRANVIAQTEALAASHAGRDELYSQGIEAGLLNHGVLIQTWHTEGDERVRGSHAFMHGQVRPFGEPFLSGDGNLLRYPGDPEAPPGDRIGCRCSKEISFFKS